MAEESVEKSQTEQSPVTVLQEGMHVYPVPPLKKETVYMGGIVTKESVPTQQEAQKQLEEWVQGVSSQGGVFGGIVSALVRPPTDASVSIKSPVLQQFAIITKTTGASNPKS